MACLGSRKCINCKTFFRPDPRSKGRQKYCFRSACRKASKRASQLHWSNKPENKQHFCGPENVLRVQQWRAKNPGYWKKKQPDTLLSMPSTPPLQETLIAQVTEKQQKSSHHNPDALQDYLIAQPPVLIGLIAQLTGSTLQDDIVKTCQNLRQLGEDFLQAPKHYKGAHNAIPSFTQPQQVAPNPS